jgi:hypothetical protein
MRTFFTIAIACALFSSGLRVRAVDCPSGVCPIEWGSAPPYSPSIIPPGGAVPNPAPPAANNIQVDSRPIARIENTVGSGHYFGSGTLVDVASSSVNPRGVVITCAHLFPQGVGQVTVAFTGAAAVSGQVLKLDQAADLAAISIPAPAITPVEIAERYPQRGEPVVSCGFGSDGRLLCNRGHVLGYVVTLGSRGRETLELSGAARQGDSGGPVLNERGLMVGVLFGTNGRVVDATYCGRVRAFLAGLSARFGGGAGGSSAQPPGEAQPQANAPAPLDNPSVNNAPSTSPLDKLPPILRRPKQREQADGSAASAPERASPLDKAEQAAAAAAGSWLTAKGTALLVSLGIPGGIAGAAAGAVVWFVMRRGKDRLQAQLDALHNRGSDTGAITSAQSAAPASSSPADPAPSVVERHHNRYVPYEASNVDRAWASAHARVSERYPGAVPYLKIVEGVKNQLLSGIDDPQFS